MDTKFDTLMKVNWLHMLQAQFAILKLLYISIFIRPNQFFCFELRWKTFRLFLWEFRYHWREYLHHISTITSEFRRFIRISYDTFDWIKMEPLKIFAFLAKLQFCRFRLNSLDMWVNDLHIKLNLVNLHSQNKYIGLIWVKYFRFSFLSVNIWPKLHSQKCQWWCSNFFIW